LSVVFHFDHCIVCRFSFWPLYCLSFFILTVVLSVVFQFTASGYPLVSPNFSYYMADNCLCKILCWLYYVLLMVIDSDMILYL
jgi:hypothetical protein